MAHAANKWTGFGLSGTALLAEGLLRSACAAFCAGDRGDCGAGLLVEVIFVDTSCGQVSLTYFSHCTSACVEINQLRGRRRVDGVGRPKFDFHTGATRTSPADYSRTIRLERGPLCRR